MGTAESQLSSNVGDLFASRHADAAQVLRTYAQENTGDYEALDTERDNILGGLTWVWQAQQDDQLVRCGRYLGQYFIWRGYWEIGREWLSRCIRAAGRQADQVHEAWLRHHYGSLLERLGDPETAYEQYQCALRLSEELGQPDGIADALHQMGTVLLNQGRYAEARSLLERSLALKEDLGNQIGVAATLHQLASIALEQGHYKEAETLLERSFAIQDALDDSYGMAATLHQLAHIAAEQGRYAEAQELYAQCLALDEQLGNPAGYAATQGQLGHICIQSERRLSPGRRLPDRRQRAVSSF